MAQALLPLDMTEAWVLPRIGTKENPLRLGVLISGSGSGMEALLKHQKSEGCLHTTVVVISDKPEVGGLERAQKHGVLSVVVPLPVIENRDERRLIHEDEVDEILVAHGVEVVILSGYMRILTSNFVNKWAGRLLNIHPSLLPEFPGAHAHRDVIAAEAKRSGCTVHFVDSQMDSGPIIAQKAVDVFPEDDENTLAERIKAEEHQLYPTVIDDLAAGRIKSP
jgi:phosphoribosylglycinamide formyltransferase-1